MSKRRPSCSTCGHRAWYRPEHDPGDLEDDQLHAAVNAELEPPCDACGAAFERSDLVVAACLPLHTLCLECGLWLCRACWQLELGDEGESIRKELRGEVG